MPSQIKQVLIIPKEYLGQRFDQALAKLLPNYSRMKLKEWIEAEKITANGLSFRPKDKVKGEETIDINVELAIRTPDQPELIQLNIAYEDEDVLVLNKPAGLVVHPGAGNPTGTLLNALLHHDAALAKLPRAGIIHRLDKDTSGLLLVAKTLPAYTHLVKALEQREIERIYQLIAEGLIISGGTIDAPMDRHPRKRTHMAVIEDGRDAVTHYRVIEKFLHYTWVQAKLETGRTHQIRVHMAYIHHPIVGDSTYGGRLKIPKGASPELMQMLRSFKRQALHASSLAFAHPITGEPKKIMADIPKDMQELVAVLRAEKNKN